MFKKVICYAGLLALVGCATTYDTEKSVWTGGTGFAVNQLGPDIWEVDFTGNDYTSRDKARGFVLKKAAELTLKSGYKYFKVLSSDTKKDITGQSILWGSTTSYSNTKTNSMVRIKMLKNHDGGDETYDANFLVGK